MLLTTLSYTLLLSRWAYAATKNQDFIDNTDPCQDEEKSPDSSSHHPYGKSELDLLLFECMNQIIVGIPIGTWKITDTNSTERQDVCDQQLAFCTNKCGGTNAVTKNFCNTATMAWDCKCQNHVPDAPPYAWPITMAECRGKESACNEGCTYGATKGICLEACNHYYRCNQAGSPPSGLKVENENDIPKYDVASNNRYTSSSLSSSVSLIVKCKRKRMISLSICIVILLLIIVYI